MRAECFIGVLEDRPSVRWLVNRRFHYQWVDRGGRAIRDAVESDGNTDRFEPLTKTQRRFSEAAAAAEVVSAAAAAASLETTEPPKPRRKRRSKKQAAA